MAFFLGRGEHSCGVVMCESSAKKINFDNLPLITRTEGFSGWDGF